MVTGDRTGADVDNEEGSVRSVGTLSCVLLLPKCHSEGEGEGFSIEL